MLACRNNHVRRNLKLSNYLNNRFAKLTGRKLTRQNWVLKPGFNTVHRIWSTIICWPNWTPNALRWIWLRSFRCLEKKSDKPRLRNSFRTPSINSSPSLKIERWTTPDKKAALWDPIKNKTNSSLKTIKLTTKSKKSSSQTSSSNKEKLNLKSPTVTPQFFQSKPRFKTLMILHNIKVPNFLEKNCLHRLTLSKIKQLEIKPYPFPQPCMMPQSLIKILKKSKWWLITHRAFTMKSK